MARCIRSFSKHYSTLCRRAHAAKQVFISNHTGTLLLLLGLFLLFHGLQELGIAQDVGDGDGGGDVEIDTTEIEKGWCQLYRLIEGKFGGLVATVAGIGAIVASAFAAYRAAVSLVVTAVGAFILRALVSLWFGEPDCNFGGGGGDGGGPAPIG